MGISVAILLTGIFGALTPYFVCGLSGATVGWLISLIFRKKFGATAGGLSGLLVGGIGYAVLKLIVLDHYLQSFPLAPSKTPNELMGRSIEWATSTPYWVMFGTMLAAGAITGALGTSLIFIMSSKGAQAKPIP